MAKKKTDENAVVTVHVGMTRGLREQIVLAAKQDDRPASAWIRHVCKMEIERRRKDAGGDQS